VAWPWTGGGPVPWVHGGPIEWVRPDLIRAVHWQSGGQGDLQAMRGDRAAAPDRAGGEAHRRLTGDGQSSALELDLGRGWALREARRKANLTRGTGRRFGRRLGHHGRRKAGERRKVLRLGIKNKRRRGRACSPHEAGSVKNREAG
jgi:hypothetical protein